MGYKPPHGFASITAYQKRPALSFDLTWLKIKGVRGSFDVGLHHVPLIFLYVIALWLCYQTAGNPYQAMLLEQNLVVEKAKQDAWDTFDKLEVLEGENVKTDTDGDGLIDIQTNAIALKEKKRLEREEQKAKALEEDPFAMFKGKNGMFPDWFADPDEDPDEPTKPPMPSEFMPDFWPTFFLVSVMCAHALLQLSQHWSVDINLFLRYKELPPDTRLQAGMYAKLVPIDPRQPTELCLITESKQQPKKCLWYECQKRRHCLEEGDDEIVIIEANVHDLTKKYLSFQGHNEKNLPALQEKFGLNKFEIAMPEFFDLFIEQVIRPMCVFQLFCQGLWLLDEAWTFALFGLFSIMGMEATSVFSRLKHIKTIRGMGNKSFDVFVYRDREWTKITTEQLLPGDIMSVKLHDGAGGDVIPCDCLILRGTAVVNEATLTGESIPQMKEEAHVDDEEEVLDIKNTHKMNVLFGGTSLIQFTGREEDEKALSNSNNNNRSNRDITPDKGLLCYVLRTGFSSSQGKLVQMIEFSSNSNNRSSGDPEHLKESFYLIGLLLIFAIIASSYVMYYSVNTVDSKGKKRTRYQLLIRCIIIVTSVVPSDLPMQLALAVNASLMQLMRKSVFCTEPFRVPMAGRVDCCFFDKTGTITTDEMEAVGSVDPSLKGKDSLGLQSSKATNLHACRVIAGCHSLLEVGDKITGDPIETAALRAIGWDYDHKTSTSFPVFGPRQQPKKEGEVETEQSKKRALEKQEKLAMKKEEWIKLRSWGAQPQKVRILRRYHFESRLQRMSVLAVINDKERQVLVKGSPEAIGKLLLEVPENYQETYTKLVKEGRRVIALAYRDITQETAGINERELQTTKTREWAEKSLIFAGFFAFQCLTRKDSKTIITDLIQSNHSVFMITGDNILTAIHVGCEVGLTREKSKVLILHESKQKEGLEWRNAENDNLYQPFVLENLPTIYKEYDMCVSGNTLTRLLSENEPEQLSKHLYLIRIFARMTPSEKEKVLSLLNDSGHTTLMCGDGANDVGALKMAHVGVALLGGFGSLNTMKNSDEKKELAKKQEMEIFIEKSDEELETMGFFDRIKYENERTKKINEKMKELKSKQSNVGKNNQAEMKEILMIKMQEETKRLEAQGETFAQFKAMKNVMAKQQQEQRAKMSNAGGGFTASAAAMALMEDGGALEGLDEGGLPMLKLGDASVAAPFTSKRPSIVAVQDIIRQGRCTLVSRVQNNQIICLTCLISSYSLSALYLEGVKFSDYQLTISGVLMTSCHLALSYTSPLTKISSARPLNSMFHPSLFISLLGQFVIHLACMIYSVSLAKSYLPADFELIPQGHGKFTPNLINTVVFLVQTMQQVAVLMVNYKGRPFQPGLTESKALLNALGLCGLGLMVCAFEVVPAFNLGIGMVPLPDPKLRTTVLILLLIDSMGTLMWDRLCVKMFAPEIHKATMTHFNTYSIYLTLRKMSVTCLAIFLMVKDGSLISLGIIFYLWKQGWF